MEFVQTAVKICEGYSDAHLEVDFENQTVRLDSDPLVLTSKEFQLLAVLVQHAGDLILRETLLQHVWGYSREIRTRTLDVHIRRLRQKLGTHSRHYIETIFGAGYRFQPFGAARGLRCELQDLALGA